MKFYKGVLKEDLCNNYIPGTVTNDFKEALIWKNRISGNKAKGAAKHVRHGKAVVIEFEFNEKDLKHYIHFQIKGLTEHNKDNCWCSGGKTKAQINTPILSYKVLTIEDECDLLFQ